MKRVRARGSHSDAGFSVLELVIVVAILSILAAIALPTLLRNRISANHSTVVGNLHAIFVANTDYNTQLPAHRYAKTLEDLAVGTGTGGVPFLEGWVVEGNYARRSGYVFEYAPNGAWSYQVTAAPETPGTSGVLHFLMTQTGVICRGELPCTDVGPGKPCGPHCQPLY